MSILALGVKAVERGLVPDPITRIAIRRLCRDRLRDSNGGDSSEQESARAAFIESMRTGPIALVPEKANEQHYELPPEFFSTVLGPRRKYSCCYWSNGSTSLVEAEETALALTCEQAQLQNGQEILELGCGWGSLSLWMAEHYPASRITAVSNSNAQRRFIDAEATARRLTNLHTVTADMNDFAPTPPRLGDGRFDRVISVEMFEHMRNYQLLLARIASWLRPAGKLFVHLFCHRELAYPFETKGTADWMGRYFFTGGIMPSSDLVRQFNRHLSVTCQWNWNGCHYQRTAEAWLANLDSRRDEVLQVLKSTYGDAAGGRWLQRWRVFFLAVAELFGFNNGEEWYVSQYLLQPSSRPLD